MATLPPCLTGPPPYACPGGDLSGLDLRGLDLTNANLAGATLNGTSFAGVTSMNGADLTGATMGNGTDFTGCDLSTTVFGPTPKFGGSTDKPTVFAGAKVPYVVLGSTWSMLDLNKAAIVGMPDSIEFFEVIECDISGVDFSGKSLKNAHFSGVMAHGTKFIGSTLNNVVFGHRGFKVSDLTGAKLSGATIPGGVFDTSTLDSVDFTGSNLTGATFLNASLQGTIFDTCDVTACYFSSPPRWSSAAGNNTSFNKATINLSTLKRNWSFLNLASATIVELDSSVDLTYLQAKYAVLDGLTLAGKTINNANFEGATLNGTNFTKSVLPGAVMNGVQGEKTVFDGANLTAAHFGPITSGDSDHIVAVTSLLGVSCKGATMTGADVTMANFGPAGSAAKPVPSTFDGATMTRVAANSADFSQALLTGGIAMHGANFSNATLKRANMTGVALGSLSMEFRIDSDAPNNAYSDFLNALTARDTKTVIGVFATNGITLAPAATTISAVSTGKAWRVKDQSETYTVLVVTASDSTVSLQVFGAATDGRGSLSQAFMPDAVLNDANLTNVDAYRAQIFTTSATNQLAGAILYGINFSQAILGSDNPISMVGANLFHAILSGAFLANANMAKSDLTGANLDNAQLQGIDLTDSTLAGGVVLNNSAISTKLETGDQGDVYGVYLFEVQSTSPDFDAIVSELKSATTLTLATKDQGTDYHSFIQDLNSGKPQAVLSMLADKGVSLSKSATVSTVARDHLDKGVAWQIASPDAGTGKTTLYTLWSGYDSFGEHILGARPSLTNLRASFKSAFQLDVAWQATITKGQANSWKLNNNSFDPANRASGYGTMLLQQTPNGLVVSGTSLRASRMKTATQLEMRVITFKASQLCRKPPCDGSGKDTVFNADTICPNGSTLATNQAQGVPWPAMLRTAHGPPAPPLCVPSPIAPCHS